MRIFITGGTGFIGRYVIAEALEAGHECICLYRTTVHEELKYHKRLHWVKGELQSDWSLELKAIDAVVHLAAVGVSPQKATWEELFRVNVQESIALITNAIRSGIEKIVICGSAHEYGTTSQRYQKIPANAPLEPINPYGASKAAASIAFSALCREHSIRLSILRPFNTYGLGQNSQNLWPSLKAAAIEGKDFELNQSDRILDFVPVKLVARAFIEEVTNNNTPKGVPIAKNIGSGCAQTLKDFCQEWWKAWGAKGELKTTISAGSGFEIKRLIPEL